jgi:hypothetical protein
MLRLYRSWPMLGFINLLLLGLISVGVIVLAADYTGGGAVDVKHPSILELKFTSPVELIQPSPADVKQPSPLEMKQPSPVEVKLSGEKRIIQPHNSIYKLFLASAYYSEPEMESIPVLIDIPPERWMEWPIIPAVSEGAKEVYRKGLVLGNDPKAFSIIGDCQSEPLLFMGVYDTDQYQLPADGHFLLETISNFMGSFSRWGPGVIDGGTPATVLAQSWSPQNGCSSGEIPLECELRIHKPVIVFVNLGTHWTDRNPEYLRQIVSIILEHGAVPILATKADNLEGNFTNNLEMARLAREFDVPLWNSWGLVQDLPNGGLDPIRQGGYMYLTEDGLARRRLSALQVLDSVWRELKEE